MELMRRIREKGSIEPRYFLLLVVIYIAVNYQSFRGHFKQDIQNFCQLHLQ